ncbi:MAG: YnfA family protein [Methyloligellaceae bacterium]
MTTLFAYIGAALLEIAGCFAFWAVVRLKASQLWLIPGVACLVLFGWLLTKVEADWAGRVYAAYGGIYIAASLVWLWAVEAKLPDRWDLIGSGICVAGALIILYGPRSA